MHSAVCVVRATVNLPRCIHRCNVLERPLYIAEELQRCKYTQIRLVGISYACVCRLAMKALLTVVVALSLSAAHALRRGLGARHLGEVTNVSEDLLSRCKVHQFETYLDHFSRVRDCVQFYHFAAQPAVASAAESAVQLLTTTLKGSVQA